MPGPVDETLLRAADTELDELVASSPAPAGTVGAHFSFLPPDQLPSADAAMTTVPAAHRPTDIELSATADGRVVLALER